MYRMNWDHQLSSILSDADGSVAKIRQRLAPRGRSERATVDFFPVRDDVDFKPSLSLGFAPQMTDLSSIQTQLQQQNEAIERLTENLRSLERERHAQLRQIQSLTEEQTRLQERLQERERDAERSFLSPAAERGMEQWKREMEREISSLRAQIHRAAAVGSQEESFSSKLRREELEQLRRELDILKNKLLRQEEDTFQLQSEARETRRQNERSSKTLESFTDSYRTQSFDLSRIVSQHKSTQQEVRSLRLSVSELKEKMQGLVLSSPHLSPTREPNQSALEMGPKSGASSSDSEEDLSPTASLAEISSEELDTSWLQEPPVEPDTRRRRQRVHLSSELAGSDLSNAGSALDSDFDDVEAVRGVSDSPPDLSLSDL